ncbi:MAG TPA: aldo/keto reductase [Acidisarcina sp.]
MKPKDAISTRTPQHDRREFLKRGGAVTAAVLAGSAVSASATGSVTASTPALPVNARTQAAMPTRNLGKTGYKVGIFSLGGQASLERGNNFDQAIAIIDRALDLGVNYLDTSSIYGGPARWSEQYVGQVMKRRRNEAFLATKTKERTRDGSMRMIEESLKLLQTDHIDLWQLHDIGLVSDVDQIFAKGGAVEALLEMQDQKVVRFLGVTGHHRPDSLISAVNRHPFDCILMSMNAADPHHWSFTEELLPLAVEKQMGIIGMKVPSRGRLLSSWTPPPLERQIHTWEGSVPTTMPGTLKMQEAMYYTLTRPVSTIIVGCDSVAQLEENVALARAFTPFNDRQMQELTARAEPVSKQALFFRFMERS